jgi:hypothetical protein
LNVAGLSLALIRKPKQQFFWRKPEQFHINNETKPEKHFRQQQEHFIIGKEAIAAAVYSPPLIQ